MRSIYPNKLQRYPHFPFRVEKGLYILPISCIESGNHTSHFVYTAARLGNHVGIQTYGLQ